MNTLADARIYALTKELRSAAKRTIGPEMHVWVRSGALMDVLDALDARHGVAQVAAFAAHDGLAPHAINPLAHEQTK